MDVVPPVAFWQAKERGDEPELPMRRTTQSSARKVDPAILAISLLILIFYSGLIWGWTLDPKLWCHSPPVIDAYKLMQQESLNSDEKV